MTDVNRSSNSLRSDTAKGHVRETGMFVGIVRGNKDPQRMGRLAVYIPELGGDKDKPETWYTVRYAPPFAGATNVELNAPSGQQAKEMEGTQRSYGWWMVPPDVNNQVLVCFANGDTSNGFWIRCLYQQFMNHMVPGIALNKSTNDQLNSENLPPVCEYNRMSDENKNMFWDPKRPVFTPLHEGLREQGLYTDPERGPGTSSARRESPSKVFGFNTPRGNNIHIDDDEKNEFIRLRTRSGVQVLIHDTTGYIYMISKKGNSWMEISDEGIDMYSKKTISMRAEEGINVHSDGHVSMNAAGAIHGRGNHITSGADGSRTTVTDGSSTSHAQSMTSNAPNQQRNGSTLNDDKQSQNNGGGYTRNDGSRYGNGGSGQGGGQSGDANGSGNGTTQRVRSTNYMSGERFSDPDTDAGRTSTGVRIQAKGENNGLGIATADRVGVAAVDPAKIPYGSQIIVQTPDGPRYYIAADTGGAVKNMTASQGTAPVIDFFSNSQVGGQYTNVQVIPYTGSRPFTSLSQSQKESFFDINRFKR